MIAALRWFVLTVLASAVLVAVPLARADGHETRVQTEARVDTDTITVGDPIRVTIVLRGAPGVAFETPVVPESFGLFEVLEQRIGTPQRTPDGGSLLRLDLTVTAFRTGALAVPGMAIHFTDEAGEQGGVVTPGLAVAVRSVLGNDPSPQLLDLKPPVEVPGKAVSYTQSAATAMLVAAALAITIMLLRRQRTRPVPVPAVIVSRPGFSPESAALAELDDIEAAGLIARGDYETYYRRIAHCLRMYLEQRYSIPALSMTTNELRAAVAGGVDRWQSRVLIGIIEECDAVRWAGYAPAEARAVRALIQAHEVVSMTQEQSAVVAR